jgi:hypothetical protein
VKFPGRRDRVVTLRHTVAAVQFMPHLAILFPRFDDGKGAQLFR